MIAPIIDIRHEAIINDIIDGSKSKEVLNVGSGTCKIDYHLIKKGFNVLSTDYQRTNHFDNIMKEYFNELDFHIANIFDLTTFPVKTCDVVICCEVIEHLVEYKTVFNNLLELTENRLIITVPYRHSFDMPGEPPIGHCNYWDDSGSGQYKDINEFVNMGKPHKVSIRKIITKPEDKERNQFAYVIIIDKT